MEARYYGHEIAYGRWGIINRAGQIVIPAELAFERVMQTTEGLTAVQRDGKWGFIRIYAHIHED